MIGGRLEVNKFANRKTDAGILMTKSQIPKHCTMHEGGIFSKNFGKEFTVFTVAELPKDQAGQLSENSALAELIQVAFEGMCRHMDVFEN